MKGLPNANTKENYHFLRQYVGHLNIYSAPIECASISGTFESAPNFFTKFFFAFIDDIGNLRHFEPKLFFVIELVALSKVPLIDAHSIDAP